MIEVMLVPVKRRATVARSIGTPMRRRFSVRRARLIGSLSTSTPSQSKITSSGRAPVLPFMPISSDR